MSLSRLLNLSNRSSWSALIHVRYFSKGAVLHKKYNCKLLVVGGGSGGCTIASKFAKKYRRGELIIIEPAEWHYYQAMFTLIGGGMKTLEQSRKPMGKVLPKNVTWLKDCVVQFSPGINCVQTSNGDVIEYDFMVVGIGLQLHYDQVEGLLEGLNQRGSGVCSNYSPKYVQKTFETLQEFKCGNALFTLPATPLKCPGAPQKAAYIAEDYFRRNKLRDKANVIYNTSLPVLFGVKKYCDALWEVVKRRNIEVNLRQNLIAIDPVKKTATFENLETCDIVTYDYAMINVTPPMGTPDALCKHSGDLVNENGFVTVCKDTLQHDVYPNVFAIGDCSNSPNSKTAAAISSQAVVIYQNLQAVMHGRTPQRAYSGYASCPLVTGYSKCILAEFDYDLKPMETFPFNQAQESRLMFFAKKEIMPEVYWMMLKGYWSGPATMRKIMHFGFVK